MIDQGFLKRMGIAAFLAVLLTTGVIAPTVISQDGAQQGAQESITVSTVAELDGGTGGVAVDANGDIFVADIGLAPSRTGRKIFKVTPDGEVSTFISEMGLLGPSGNAFDSEGNLFQSSLTGTRVHKITPDGEVSQFAIEGITGPVGVVVNDEGTVFVANCRSGSIQKVSADGTSTRFINSPLLACPNGIALDDDGNIYVSNFSNGRIIKITPEAEAEVFATVPNSRNLGHITYAGNGLFYVVSRGSHQIYTLNLEGELAVFAGSGERGHDDGPALEATFSLPNDISISPDGKTLYLNEVLNTEANINTPSVVRAIHLPDTEASSEE